MTHALITLEKRSLDGTNGDAGSTDKLAADMPATNKLAIVTLNRPDKKNAMSFALLKQLKNMAKTISKDKSIRAVIITGTGGVFSAGIDLSDLGNPKNMPFALYELIKPTKSLFQSAFLCWQDVPVPVIAVMEGYCIGAGMQLALAADIRVSATDCQHAIMESRWGLVPDMGLTTTAAGLVRADVLKELTMTARMVGSTEAEQLGLTTHVSDTPMDKALALAAELATRSPDAALAAKRVINTMLHRSKYARHMEKWWQLKLMLGRNSRIAMREKNTPKFKPRQFG